MPGTISGDTGLPGSGAAVCTTGKQHQPPNKLMFHFRAGIEQFPQRKFAGFDERLKLAAFKSCGDVAAAGVDNGQGRSFLLKLADQLHGFHHLTKT